METTLDFDSAQFDSPQFWESLCPHLNINQTVPLSQLSEAAAQKPIRPPDWELCKQLISEEGYFAYDSYFEESWIENLAEAFRCLEKAAIPPIFCFVYDEFWELMHRLDPLLRDLIGDYWMLPAVWAWHVQDENQTAFSPHRDQVRESAVDDEDHLDYLTLWIPLTNLDHLSSCICVVPASADPDYDMGTEKVRVENLQDIRMLQGQKGSVFCWTTGLIHWGTRQSKIGIPRMSIGLCVQNPEADCFDPPPIEYNRAYSLTDRLSIIGQQIINYSREANEKTLKLATRLAMLSQQAN